MYETRNETAQALPALNPRCQWRTGFVMHPADVFLSRCLRHALQLCAGSSAASGCLAVGRPGWLLLAPIRLPRPPGAAQGAPIGQRRLSRYVREHAVVSATMRQGGP